MGSARACCRREPKQIEPRLRDFQYLGDKRIRVTYEWIVGEALDGDYHCFVHAANRVVIARLDERREGDKIVGVTAAKPKAAFLPGGASDADFTAHLNPPGTCSGRNSSGFLALGRAGTARTCSGLPVFTRMAAVTN